MLQRTLTAIAALALLTAGPRLAAQSPGLPTITVTPFTCDRLSEETRAIGEASADDLAERLVASGRYRVLARDWMPLPVKGRSGPYPVATIRQAATTAGVQYVVFGSMRTSVVRIVSSPAVGYLPVQKGPPRPTLTVADFDTDRTGWMPPPGLGQTLADLLTTHLVESGAYRMLDRVWIVSSPENRGRIPFDVLLDRAAGAGVQYLVAGSVTRFSMERHSSTGGGFVPLPFVGGLIHKDKTESVIGLTLRVIDVSTGEIVVTATATSGAEHKDTHGGGIAVIGPVPIFGAKGSSSTGFADRLLDTALQQAVADAADKILAAAPRLVK